MPSYLRAMSFFDIFNLENLLKAFQLLALSQHGGDKSRAAWFAVCELSDPTALTLLPCLVVCFLERNAQVSRLNTLSDYTCWKSCLFVCSLLFCIQGFWK